VLLNIDHRNFKEDPVIVEHDDLHKTGLAKYLKKRVGCILKNELAMVRNEEQE